MWSSRRARFPDFFLVGANRGGTTSLYHHLQSHPELFMSRRKEPSFFAYAGNEKPHSYTWRLFARAFVLNETAYRALFARAGSRLAGEASTAHLHTPGAAERIHAAVPQARIIISLRDPIDCFVSRTRTLHTIGFRWPDLHRAVVEFDEGRSTEDFFYYRYHDLVLRYLTIFGAERVKILLFDDLRADPVGTVQSIYAFLGVDPTHTPTEVRTRFNHFEGDDQAAGLTPDLLQYLADRTRADTAKLAALIGRDLSHWTCFRMRDGG
jgi:hypothetical protein